MDSSSTDCSGFNVRYPVKEQFVYQDQTFPGAQCTIETIKRCREFEIRADDICLVGYPRTGTRWTAEILSWIYHEGDEEKMKARNNFEGCPLMEFTGLDTALSIIPITTQRLFTTHLSANLAPRELGIKGKTIKVLRNPKDAAVSLFHFYKINTVLGPYDGTWSEFLQGYINGEVIYGSYFNWIKSWHELRDQPKHLMFVCYEEMKREPDKFIREIAAFLEKDLSESTVQLIAEKTSFASMQVEPNANFSRHPVYKVTFRELEGLEFIRKGQVGDWKNFFTVAQSDEFDEVVNKELKGLDMKFEY